MVVRMNLLRRLAGILDSLFESKPKPGWYVVTAPECDTETHAIDWLEAAGATEFYVWRDAGRVRAIGVRR